MYIYSLLNSCTEKTSSPFLEEMEDSGPTMLVFVEQTQVDLSLDFALDYDDLNDLTLEMHLDLSLPDSSVDAQPVREPLGSYLPTPHCVAYLNESCLIEQSPTGLNRCEQWRTLIQDPPNPVPFSDINQCHLEDIPTSTLQATQEYVN